MHFADVLLDKPQGETDCCDFSVYSVVVQIKKYIRKYNLLYICHFIVIGCKFLVERSNACIMFCF